MGDEGKATMDANCRTVIALLNQWWVFFICVLFVLPASAQEYNFNIGAGPGFPLARTGDFAGTSYNFVAGGGPNLLPHLKMNAEFMFQGLPIHQSIIDRIGVSKVKGRLYSLTVNLMVGAPLGVSKSVYLIGGGGWYRRTVEAQQTVLQAGEKCEPIWVWWNVQCVNGIFPTDVTIGSSTSSAGGFNIGGGLTFALGESSTNFLAEVRYHRAFTRNMDTVVLPVTFGLRW
jgi:hypothetical protein